MSLSKENPEVLLPFVEAGCNAAEIAAFFWVSYSAAARKIAEVRKYIANKPEGEK